MVNIVFFLPACGQDGQYFHIRRVGIIYCGNFFGVPDIVF